MDAMKNTLSDEQWCTSASKALELLDVDLHRLDGLGCYVAAAHMSQAIDSLQQDMKKRSATPSQSKAAKSSQIHKSGQNFLTR